MSRQFPTCLRQFTTKVFCSVVKVGICRHCHGATLRLDTRKCGKEGQCAHQNEKPFGFRRNNVFCSVHAMPRNAPGLLAIVPFQTMNFDVPTIPRRRPNMKQHEKHHMIRPLSVLKLRNGQSTVGGPKWIKMHISHQNAPFWSPEC